MAWYVVSTNIKSERKALDEIRRKGFEAYLPEYKIERFNKKKRVGIVTTLCLYPRYLFVEAATPGDLGRIRSCNGVEEFLPGRPHEPMPVPESDVLELRAAQADLRLDDTDEARRHRGETTRNTLAAMRRRLRNKAIKVTEGPFANLPATVERVHSMERLRVLIDLFGRATPVELEFGQWEELAGAA
ncbi:MAG TPA: transcription termination/antitermination protein NusG [Devosia sp.]|nr:transcription termination/antitermination protein NusG [Devosia sp.]